jgi:hypothetical protein
LLLDTKPREAPVNEPVTVTIAVPELVVGHPVVIVIKLELEFDSQATTEVAATTGDTGR